MKIVAPSPSAPIQRAHPERSDITNLPPDTDGAEHPGAHGLTAESSGTIFVSDMSVFIPPTDGGHPSPEPQSHMVELVEPIRALLGRWRPEPPSEASGATALTALVAIAAQEASLLRQYHADLADSRKKLGLLNDVPLLRAYWEGWVDALHSLVEHLLQLHLPAAAGERDQAVLLSMVRTRANAEEVLGVLAEAPRRFREIVTSTGLDDQKVNRVLTWGLRVDLVARSGTVAAPIYRLTPLGESAMRGLHEPKWALGAASLSQLVLRRRLTSARRLTEDLVSEAARRAALTATQTRRVLEAFIPALHPASWSPLARALGARSAHGVRLRLARWAGSRRGALAEALLERTLERAGVGPEHVQEVVIPSPGEAVYLPLEDSILSVSHENPVSQALIDVYGGMVQIGSSHATVPFDDGDYGMPWTTHGLLLRFYHTRTGASHFVLAGTSDDGVFAACRYFYEAVDDLLEEHPYDPFACLLVVDGDVEGNVQMKPVRSGRLAAVEPAADWLHVYVVPGADRRSGLPDRRLEVEPEPEEEEELVPA